MAIMADTAMKHAKLRLNIGYDDPSGSADGG